MDLRQLQHFVTVAEEQHFTRAAQRLHIVQSALSTSIRTLEDELGTALLIRSTRQMRLTAAGTAFLEKARVVLAAARDAKETVRAIQGLDRGVLRIGTVKALPAFLDLPALLAAFHAAYPGVAIRLYLGSAAHLIEKVRTERLEIAFLPLCEDPRDLGTTAICCDVLVAVCAPNHPLAGRRNVPLAALANEDFIEFERSSGVRKVVDRGFEAAGVDRRVAFEVNDLDTVIAFASRGLGISLLPGSISALRTGDVATIELETEMCWELVAAYPAEKDGLPVEQAPRRFLDLLRSATANVPNVA